MFNLFRTAAFLAILMLCAAHSSGQGVYIGLNPALRIGTDSTPIVGYGSGSINRTILKDTIQVFIMVADTSKKTNIYKSYVIAGYEVREVDSVVSVEIDDPNKTIYHGNGVYSSTLMGIRYRDIIKPKYSHVIYLDYKKTPLPKKLSVFSVHPRG